jgi:hypothetical protein
VVKIHLANDACALGETLRLEWNTQSKGLERLIISLQCEEKASYRRGTDTRTDTSLCWIEEILDSEDPVDMRSGRCEIPLPENLMPTWSSENNCIQWKVLVEGKLKGWGQIKDEYIITVVERNIW